ncbi:MAG TPA: alpha/beta hydrolase [Vicinamibacterales bacterium]|nr:alpha/beta hydrolase [Vicinamibacterales bacterium]
MTLKTVRYTMPAVHTVTARLDIVYEAGDEGLRMDLYSPPRANDDARLPAVVIVLGYRDVGVPLSLGCQFKEFGMSTSWARLLAASGMVAVVYTTRTPATDIHAVLQHLRRNAAALGVDPHRIGLLAASANVAVALSALMQDGHLTCAALLYGFTLDLDGSTTVADMSRTYGFANACAGRSIDDLPSDIPLLVVRAGKDQFAGLNASLDMFLTRALERNLPLNVINYPSGAHAFDLDEDTDASRDIVRQTLAFLRFQLVENSHDAAR